MLLIVLAVLYHNGPVIAGGILLGAVTCVLGVSSGLLRVPWWSSGQPGDGPSA